VRENLAVPLSVRPAVLEDRELLFAWANDPLTRAQSFSPAVIPWDTHCAWLASVLDDPGRLLYVVVGAADEPVGQVRFDGCGSGEAVISISLAPAWRGRGLAASAIRLAMDRARRDAGIVKVHAFIRPGNRVSRQAFARAGYLEVEEIAVQGEAAVHLTGA
jgi:RimJ/RimL family protein N-acetyltransferase